MKSGLLKPVAELKSGDVVIAMNIAKNEVVESEILMVAHSSPTTLTLFTAIEAWNGQKVFLTPKHLIALSLQTNTTPSFIYAENVQENDYIYVRDEYNQLMSVKVKSVSEEMKMGYYSPLTLEGTIIVNDVVTSVYALINSHHLAHNGLAPLRWYYKIVKSLGLANEPFAPPKPNGQLHWTNQFLYLVSKTLAPHVFS
ncbi:unnamed protein product [Didymodactylos carnosus]|uniref:Hedgehog protein Hint domain-containing protein n=1 Tax=Didymodactylos carnosus TaxID=1234261 RepID=A0A813ZRD3_9BILA|nr:unnamed protein product [Didymodactylos carnosus]CAF0902802.1 unnamed protein product [Didymodactylos carnosus]CAF3494669.1 unnamed protein product [Didymodactylos carnosus]CAF3685047.1 unnamed protein product [Didymodactylos carnosus]